MAKVPYNPIPQAEPSMQGTPEINVPTNEAAFGGNVAQAVSSLGRTIQGAGDEMFTRALALQDLDNRTAADEAANQAIQEQGIAHEEYRAILGRGAKADLPSHMQNLEAIRDKHRDSLTNPAARRLYDSQTRSQTARLYISGANHAATQNKDWMVKTSQARIELVKQEAFSSPENDVGFAKGLKDGEEQIKAQGAMLGWGEEQILAKKKDFLADMLAQRIKGVAQREPSKAAELLEKNKSLLGVNYDATERVVQTNVRQTGSRVIENEVTAGGGSLEEKIKKGKELAKKYAPNDPLLQDWVDQRITGAHTQQQVEKRDTDMRNRLVIHGAMLVRGPDGKPPTTLEQLFINPEIKKAYEALDETAQLGIQKGLNANIRREYNRPLTPKEQARWAEIKGMAIDYDSRQKFLELNIPAEGFPWAQTKQLQDLQFKYKESAEADPRVGHALGVLRSMMSAAGVTRKDDEVGYNQFLGNLQDALDLFQDENQKAPKKDDIEAIGQRLLLQKQQGLIDWVKSGFSSESMFFKTPVPSERAEIIRRRPYWADRGINPDQVTDEMIRRIYIIEEYKKLFSKPPAKPKGPQVPRQ